MRIGFISHTQTDPQIGIRAKVVFDHSRRPLGGHHEMDAEGPATLGDVNHTIDELGHLTDERGELVDHDHKGGRRVEVTLFLQRKEVLCALCREQLFAPL